MKTWIRCSGAALLLASPVALMAGKPVETWGKPGVSFDQYRRDAVTCASTAARRDVEDDAETVRFVKGFRNLERENNMPPFGSEEMNDVGERTDRQAFIHRRNQPQRNADGLQRKLVSEVQQCLRKRGYAQIRLTRAQSKALSAYKPGSVERQRYLHAITSAPRDG